MNDVALAERSPPGYVEGTVLTHGVTVVIPAFNEAPHVAEQILRVQEVLAESGWDFEIILVDDGSSDGTAAAAAGTNARIIRNVRNLGYGASLKRGIRAANHEWILITDADGTYPAEVIPRLLALAANPQLGLDMATGARVGQTVRIPLVRRPAKWFLNQLASYLAGQRLPDLNSGLRLMRREIVEQYIHLLPNGFSFTTTITLACACNGHLVEFVPIDYHARLGASKIRSRHAFDFTLLIVRTIVFFNPLKVFLPMGLVIALLGLAKLVYDLLIGNVSESAIFALLAAMIIWSVGLLADQNARIATHR